MATQATHLVRTPSVEWIARFSADYSYSLYLIHYTILHAIKKLWPEFTVAGMIAGILLSNIVAIVLAEIGEKHHRKLARLLKGRLAGWTAFKPAE
jgi:peptidoglycan/LPS O-acetylase OafA/YrhL